MGQVQQLIRGVCQQLLFSPKGRIEGALVMVRGKVVQVSVSPGQAAALLRASGVGRPLRVLAERDRSPKTANATHKVFKFASLADAEGKPTRRPEAEDEHVTIKGVVQFWHYARHGETNGVILETGEFIHLRPRGMAVAGLDIGSQVTATGALRMTVLGTRLLEARRVNQIDLL